MMDCNWIENIPDGWKLLPLKRCFSLGKGLSITKADLTEDGLNVLSYGQVHSKMNPAVSIPDELLRHINEEFSEISPASHAEKNGFIFADTSEDLEGCGNCNYVDRDDVYAGYHTIILKPATEGENWKYLAYLFQTDAWRYQLRKELTEVKLYSVSQKVLKQTSILVPPKQIREAIVSYLDSKCSAIDEAIERHKKIIEKLEDYRKKLITYTVTKGLVKNRPMKKISADWIGDIPADWDYIKITWILDNSHPYPIGDGDHGIIKTEDYQENGIPYIRVQNLGWGAPINTDNIVYISEEMNAKIGNSTLRPGDVLFAKTGATIGKTAFVPEDIPISNTTSHVGKITISPKYNAKYIFYVLSSYVGYKQFWDFADMKATRPELAISEIKTIKVTLPRSRTEQDEIVSFLDGRIEKISKIIEGKRTTIKQLEEYRKSIIYNAVTGKIDCRKSA